MDDILEICQEINLLPREEKQELFRKMVECLDGESIRCLETALDVVI